MPVLAVGCGDDNMRCVSERRSGYYTATGYGMTLTAVSGVRENNFAADGKAGTLKPYTLITLAPEEFDMDKIYTYTVSVNGRTFGGTMIVHPFAASFSAELEYETQEEFDIEIADADKKSDFAMKSLVTPDMITFDRAIDTAKSALKPKGEYEIRARIIKNPLGTADGVCWHINFISGDGATGVLLDPVSAKILAKK